MQMLRKPFHGWTIEQEIRKLTAFRTPSSYLNPVRESRGSATRPTALTSLSLLPPKSHFRFTHQSISTSSLATGPSAASYYSRALESYPNTHLKDPNLNVESLRESSDGPRENGGDGEGFGRGRTLPEKRALLFTCVSEDGECYVYAVDTTPNSRELCIGNTEQIFCLERKVTSVIICPCDLVTLESLKQNPEVVNKLEVHSRDKYDVAKEELMKYGGQVMPLKEQGVIHSPCIHFQGNATQYPFEQENKTTSFLKSTMVITLQEVANMLEVYLGRGFRVAYEKAMKYGFRVMVHHFPLQVALCSEKRLSTKISLIRSSLLFETTDLVVGPWKRRSVPSSCSRLWRVCLLHLLEWIQSTINVGRKK